MSMAQPLVSLIGEFDAHPVSNPDDHLCLTDPGFLETTDSMTVNQIDAIDAETRALLSNDDGTINRWALTALRIAGVDVREAGSREDTSVSAIVIRCSHGELVILL